MDPWLRKWIAFKRVLREADIVLHVVDARDAFGTLDRDLNKYKSKLLVAINKCDLMPEHALKELDERLYGYKHVFISSTTGKGFHNLYLTLSAMSKRKPPKVAIVGYPNVGKSSLMNRLGSRHAARVSPIPGETKGVQWVSASGFLFVDTPGVIPTIQQSGKDLVIRGAVRADAAPNPEPIAEEILKKFLNERPAAIKECYDIRVNSKDDPPKIMEKIAKRRGRLLKGGELDLFETAKLVIRDYQKGSLSLR